MAMSDAYGECKEERGAIPAGRGGLVDGLIPETRMARDRSCPPSASSRCWNALCFPASRRRRRFHRVSHQRDARW